MNDTERRAKESALGKLACQSSDWWIIQMATDSTLRKGELFRRYPALGSDKTFSRFLRSDFADTATTLDEWLGDYQTGWQIIDELTVRQASAGVTVLNTLTGVKAVRRAVKEMTGEGSSRRVLVVTGESGSGKTCCAMTLQKLWGQRVATVEVTNVWADKPNRLLTAICSAVGMRVEGLPPGAADKLPLLVRHLSATRTCLILEEGHHMGPQCLNTLKTLVNQTPGEFVIIAIPTLLRRLQMAAYEEARQIFASHRLAGRIDLSVTAGDAALILTDRLGANDAIAPAARWLTDATRAPKHGNYGFIRDVADEVIAHRARTESTAPVTAADIQSAAEAVIKRR